MKDQVNKAEQELSVLQDDVNIEIALAKQAKEPTEVLEEIGHRVCNCISRLKDVKEVIQKREEGE